MAEWRVRPLSELTENLDARRIPIKEADRRAGPYPYYGASGVVDHVDDFLFEGLHLLIAEDGENLRTRKSPTAFLADGRFWVNNHAHVVRGNDEADTRFLLYALLTADVTSYLSGSTMPKLTQGNLNRIPILAPCKSEQLGIAAVLGALDDKIDLNRRMNETLEAMARAIFKDWFVDFGPTRARMEGRAPYLAADIWSLFPDALDEDGRPEGWLARPVGDFAELKGGKQFAKERITPEGSIPVFGGAGIMGFTDEHNADGFVISVGRVGAYCGQFFSHRGRAWINNNASLIRPFDGVSGEWLFQALRHADIEVIKKGAAQPFVSNTDVASMPIIWAGENIVSHFAESLVPLMLKAEQGQAESATLAATRDLLLPKLMSGEIRVKDAEKLAAEVT